MLRPLMLSLLLSSPLAAQEAAMTPQALAGIITDVDPEATITAGGMELTIQDIPVLVIMAPGADRMRAMVPIASVEDVTPEELSRMMQANFDTALDARYAIAQGRVWAVFIHPLGALEREQFLSALAQTVNLARTYGTLYSGGAQHFGGGDSAQLYQDLFEDLQGRGTDL